MKLSVDSDNFDRSGRIHCPSVLARDGAGRWDMVGYGGTPWLSSSTHLGIIMSHRSMSLTNPYDTMSIGGLCCHSASGSFPPG